MLFARRGWSDVHVENTDCSGKVTRFGYDARGVLARVTDAAGQSTVYETDAMGRVTGIGTACGRCRRRITIVRARKR
ncbi:RHS repeat domain-containing protein [Burkholderia sp. AU45251]|uniref:RHS repeat domain-containing protein n=1 Tax=Burkholderia sp. AU45251 TaxID=3059204 RepID=UPI00264B39E2|nr:RHS repeat domain-containing protein [Burkholderia sp. AU45251]MDN7514776.1 RHS repeat protein [Burkholderia sp. AU45251]